MKPIGSHTTVSDLSSEVTITIPPQARYVEIQALTQNVRMTLDASTAATTTVGFQIAAGGEPLLHPCHSNGELSLIEETASASVAYQFWG